MRIAILIDSLARGGAERQAIYSARELARRGCEVEILHYYRLDDQYDLADASPARGVYLKKNGRPVRFLGRLRNHLKAGRFDVLHAYKETPCIYGSIAARLAGVPVIVAGYRCQLQGPRWLRMGMRLVNRLATAWVVNSRSIINSLVDGIGADREKFEVVYNGIDPDRFRSGLSRGEARARLGLPPGDPVVVIIALLRPEKNHALFFETAALVLRQTPHARFLVVGDGLLRGTLQSLVERLGLAGRVHFMGTRTDIPEILAASDVSVLTSHYEGMSNVLMESMAAGVPVAAVDFAGVTELLTDGQEGVITPMGDALALAERITQLLGDARLREEMGRRGMRTVAERFTLERMAGDLLAVYQKHLAAALERRGTKRALEA